MLKKISYGRVSTVVLLAALLSFFSSSYLEAQQSYFFAGIKNLMEHGSFSRFKDDSSGLLTLHNGDYYINPVHVFQKVLAYSELSLIKESGLSVAPYSFFDHGDVTDTRVIRIADFVIENFQKETINGKDIMRYPYPISYEAYNLNAPWYSGMAQGHGAIVFLHAWKITGQKLYLDYAIMSINTLMVKLEDGGVLLDVDQNGVWFEEYADPRKKIEYAPRVLNGHIFAVDGLFWLWSFTNNKSYYDLLLRSIDAVNSTISQYDTGLWSYYGMWRNFAHAGYHRIHIEQLQRLATYTEYLDNVDMPNINSYSEKFEVYESVPFLGYVQRMIYQRNNMVFLIYFSNFFVLALIFFTFSILRFRF